MLYKGKSIETGGDDMLLLVRRGMLKESSVCSLPARPAWRRETRRRETKDIWRGIGEAAGMATYPLTSPQREAFIERLRHLGLRVTPQRLLVLEALATSGGHMTADAILRWTAERYPAINLATIYRTLDLLASVGIVTQTDLGGGASEFEIVGDTLHHHLVCERCGAVTEVDDALLVPMRERLLREYGFRASARHIGLFGVCKACLEASRTPAIRPDVSENADGDTADATSTPPRADTR